MKYCKFLLVAWVKKTRFSNKANRFVSATGGYYIGSCGFQHLLQKVHGRRSIDSSSGCCACDGMIDS